MDPFQHVSDGSIRDRQGLGSISVMVSILKGPGPSLLS